MISKFETRSRFFNEKCDLLERFAKKCPFRRPCLFDDDDDDDVDDDDSDEDDANLGQLLVVGVQVTTYATSVTTGAR